MTEPDPIEEEEVVVPPPAEPPVDPPVEPPVEEEVPVDPNAYNPELDPEIEQEAALKDALTVNAIPIVKQCQEEGNLHFGAVAVDGGPNRWGVMHPVNGGHWATNEEVWTWTVLSA